jgi:hypothetical protein
MYLLELRFGQLRLSRSVHGALQLPAELRLRPALPLR